MTYDLLLRGGLLVDGSGAPARRADVAVTGDRIAAIGDLSAVDRGSVREVLDVSGLVVAPGFVDPHSHSDASVLVDGALASHLRQGYTTQLSGNCGETLAPLTPASRSLLDPLMTAHGVVPTWTTFGGYLEAVDRQPKAANIAFVVGQGTVRASVLGASDRTPAEDALRAMEAHVAEAMDAGALGISTGLIYPPGIHASPSEIARLIAVAFRAGGVYATHMRNEADAVAQAIDEAIATAREAERLAGVPGRLQVSHLKVASTPAFGTAPALVAQLETARAAGLDVAADQYPYTAAHTTLATILPPAVLALELDAAVALLRSPEGRRRIREAWRIGEGTWENVVADPGWGGLVVAWSATRPHWAGRSLEEIAALEGGDPGDLALDVLADERLAVDCVQHCMAEADVSAIMAVPWIAVCTDAETRRPDHPILGRGHPHPRGYGSAPRVLGRYARDWGVLPLETAVAKLSGVPAARLGLDRRGEVREGWAADLVAFDPAAVLDLATFETPARYPVGIAHVVVNGRIALRDGEPTGALPGRLLRRGE